MMKEGLAYASLSFFMVLPFQYVQVPCQTTQNRQKYLKFLLR